MGRRPLSSSQEKDSPSGRLCGAPSPIDLTTGSKCVIPQWSSQSPSGWTSSYGTSWSLQPASPSRGVPPRPPGIVSSTSQWREDPTEASRTGWSVSLLGLEVLASDPSLTLLVQPSLEPSSRPSFCGKNGICPQLADILGGEDCFGEDAPEEGRWRVMLSSGSREGEELKRVWTKMKFEEVQSATWLGIEVQENLSATVESVGGSSCDGSTRGKVSEEETNPGQS